MEKKDLRVTSRELEKATKPTHLQIRSWINKKVLKTTPAAVELVEELPLLIPDPWQAHGHPENTGTPGISGKSDNAGEPDHTTLIFYEAPSSCDEQTSGG